MSLNVLLLNINIPHSTLLRTCRNQVNPTVDGRNPASHLGCIKPSENNKNLIKYLSNMSTSVVLDLLYENPEQKSSKKYLPMV